MSTTEITSTPPPLADWYRLVGTSHIATQAARAVRRAYDEFSPDAVAIELDAQRLAGLLNPEKPKLSLRMARELGVRGYLFALIGSKLQRRLGRIVNVEPGADMLAAVKVAREHNAMLLLIDRDLRATLARLNGALGWREFKQFLKDLWRGVRGKETLTIDLKGIPGDELVEKMLGELRVRYPRPYAVLVHERNVYMVRALMRFHEQHPDKRVLVVVGAGHVPGMHELFGKAAPPVHP